MPRKRLSIDPTHPAANRGSRVSSANDCLPAGPANQFSARPPRKHVFISRDGGAKPRQKPRLARQRRQATGVPPPKILKTREFSALRRNTRFPRNAWWSQAESNRQPLVPTECVCAHLH